MGAIVVAGGLSQAEGSLLGFFLALIGSITLSIYLISERYLRKKLDTFPYAASVYGIASLTLIVLALALDKPFTCYRTEDFLIFLALAIGPSCFDILPTTTP